MWLTDKYELCFKKSGFFKNSSTLSLKNIFKNNLTNLYPCVYLQTTNTQLKIVE